MIKYEDDDKYNNLIIGNNFSKLEQNKENLNNDIKLEISN